eukprot:gene2934-4808_t
MCVAPGDGWCLPSLAPDDGWCLPSLAPGDGWCLPSLTPGPLTASVGCVRRTTPSASPKIPRNKAADEEENTRLVTAADEEGNTRLVAADEEGRAL